MIKEINKISSEGEYLDTLIEVSFNELKDKINEIIKVVNDLEK